MCPEISFSSCLNELNELENLICIHKTFCILKQVKKDHLQVSMMFWSLDVEIFSVSLLST